VTPSDRVAFKGEQVVLQAGAEGTAPLIWQWFRDGAAIAGALQPTLVLPSVVEGDDDTSFSVVVSNVLGTATSSNAVLTVRPGIILSGSANGSVEPTIRRGWPLLLEISLLHPDAFDSNAVPIVICASNGPWPGVLSATITDGAGQSQSWPWHRQTVTNESLRLTDETGGRVHWWLTPEETAGLPNGEFKLVVALKTTDVTKTNAWKGGVQSPPVILTVTNEPATLTQGDTEEKYRLLANYALLSGDRARAQVQVNALLAAYPTNIGGLTYDAYLKEAAGLFDDAFQSVQNALSQVALQSPDTPEPPGELLGKQAELFAIVAPPLLEWTRANEQLRISWTGYPRFSYRLEDSADLRAWSVVTTNFSVVSNRFSVDASVETSRRFFRVVR
jgi:hypothetical protein